MLLFFFISKSMLHIVMNARVCLCMSTITLFPYTHRRQSNNATQEREKRRFIYRPIEVIWNKLRDNKNSSKIQDIITNAKPKTHNFQWQSFLSIVTLFFSIWCAKKHLAKKPVWLIKCYRIPKGQSKMENAEKMAAYGTQNEFLILSFL